jgi:hypothetical protein
MSLRLLILNFIFATTVFSLDSEKLINSIGMVESGMNHRSIGDRSKARGAWQMHKGSWADAGKRLGLSYSWAVYSHDKEISKKYAKAYLECIVSRLSPFLKREPTPQEVYAAWRMGAEGFLNSGGYQNLGSRIKDSCERVNNLYSK